MYFLIDASGSVGITNFTKTKHFVANVAQRFPIGPQDVQIGLSSFSNNIYPKFNLSTYSYQDSLVKAINSIAYETGGTNTGIALEWIGNHAFKTASGDRNSTDNVLIVLTDGMSNNYNKTITEAGKLRKQKLTVYAVGIGSNVNQKELNAIASDNDHMIIISSFDQLGNLAANITQTECKGKIRCFLFLYLIMPMACVNFGMIIIGMELVTSYKYVDAYTYNVKAPVSTFVLICEDS